MPNCIAITAHGVSCKKQTIEGFERCNVHQEIIEEFGDYEIKHMELLRTHYKVLLEIEEDVKRKISEEKDTKKIAKLRDEFEKDREHLKRVQMNERLAFAMSNGKTPGQLELVRREQRMDATFRQLERAEDVRRGAGFKWKPPQDDLFEFTNDNQNVHRKPAIIQTAKFVKEILKIPVPKEYRWNKDSDSKTLTEITRVCNLSPTAIGQMTIRYCSRDNINDLGEGIYSKVLEGVWQYIRNSKHRNDLCKILKEELEDNVNTCTQGNLSRLCNVLSGYIESMGPMETTNERLGREIPHLMEVKDIQTRIREAIKIMKQEDVPPGRWKEWIDPLIEDEVDVYGVLVENQFVLIIKDTSYMIQ
jgi:hypothetical protein